MAHVFGNRLIHQAPPRSKGQRSKSQGQVKIVHKNIKYMPQTSFDSKNTPVLSRLTE